MKSLKEATLLMLGLVFMAMGSACKKDQPEEPELPIEVKEVSIDARDYAKWVYFSFEKGDVVEIPADNFAESLNWDIAFHRNDVRLNGGKSGKGKGGAINTGKKELAEVSEAPASGYVVDDTKSIMTKFTLPSPIFEDQPANTEVEWLEVDTSNPPPKYTLFKDVFVIKTADGKYAKIRFPNYLSKMNETMVITMEYVYQPNGSNKF